MFEITNLENRSVGIKCIIYILQSPPGGVVAKNPPASAGDSGAMGSTPGLRRSPGVGMATHSSILACKIPQTEELGGLQSMGPLRAGRD